MIFTFQGSLASTVDIDTINLVSGVNNPPSTNTFLNLDDVSDIDFTGKAGFVPTVDANELALELTVPTLPTGLEKLVDSDGDFWRLIGRNASFYQDGELGSVDLSERTASIGADNIGRYSLAFGKGWNITQGASGGGTFGHNLWFGDSNTFVNGSSATYLSYGILGGTLNDVRGGGLGALIIGQQNTVGTTNNNELIGTIVAGEGNVSTNNEWGMLIGLENFARSPGEVSIGKWGTDTTGRMLNVGTGSSAGAREDSLTVLEDGTVYAAAQTLALIATQGNDAVATKEYVDKTVLDDVTTAYTVLSTDANNIVTTNNGSSIALTIPTNAVTPFKVGTEIVLINKGAGVVTIGGAGVTIVENVGGLTMAQDDVRTIRKILVDTWSVGF